MVLDTWAKVSLLNMINFIRCAEGTGDIKLEQPDLTLLRYDCKPVDYDGRVILSVEYNGHLMPNFIFRVYENGNSTMGIDLFNAVDFYIATIPIKSVSYKSMSTVKLENYPYKRYQHKPLLVSNINIYVNNSKSCRSSLSEPLLQELKRKEAGVIGQINALPSISSFVVT